MVRQWQLKKKLWAGDEDMSKTPLSLRSKFKVVSGSWMYTTHRLMVIHSCAKYGNQPPRRRRGREFASHAGDRGSIPRSRRVWTAPLPSARQQVWVSREMTIIKRRPVSQKLWHVKEPSLHNGHECWAWVKICSPSLAMVTSPYEWKILQWDDI